MFYKLKVFYITLLVLHFAHIFDASIGSFKSNFWMGRPDKNQSYHKVLHVQPKPENLDRISLYHSMARCAMQQLKTFHWVNVLQWITGSFITVNTRYCGLSWANPKHTVLRLLRLLSEVFTQHLNIHHPPSTGKNTVIQLDFFLFQLFSMNHYSLAEVFPRGKVTSRHRFIVRSHNTGEITLSSVKNRFYYNI